MTTVTAGNTASFEVGPFDTITLTSAKGLGSLALTSQTPKIVGDQTLAVQNGTFGPWGAPMSVVLTVRQGSVDYTVNVKSSTATVAAVADSFFSATGGLWSGLVADGVPAPWATALFAKLWSSVVSDYGPQPTFARDADYSILPMVTDATGMLRDTVLGEAMFHGARRERQLCRYPEQLSYSSANGWTPENSLTVAAAWDDEAPAADGISTESGTVWLLTAAATTNSALAAQAGVVYEAVPHVFAVWMRADTAHNAEIEIAVAAGATLATKVVAVTTDWQLFYVAGTPDGSSSYVYRIAPATKASSAGGAVYVRHPRFHQRLGVTTAPPEFVPRDSYPRTKYWEGAGVDGVKYFDTLNLWGLNSTDGLVITRAGDSIGEVAGVSSDVSTWTLSGISSVSSADSDGWVKLNEDATPSAAHQINTSIPNSLVYDKHRVMFEVELKQAGASDRAWVRLAIQDLDGVAPGLNAYFDLVNGVFGTVSAGLHPVSEAITGGGWRVSVSRQFGTGAANGLVRIYSATADATATHNGDTTKGILVRNARTVLRTCRGIDLFPTTSQLMDTRFSTWTAAGCTLATVTGPDGKQSAVKLTEDTSTGAHQLSASLIGSSTYDNKWVVASVYAKQAGSSDRAWIRMNVQDLDGVAPGKSVYFNVATGQVGSMSTTGLLPGVEPIGDGWYRFHFAVKLGTGATNAVMRIYSATADGTVSFTGTVSNGVHLFGPNVTSAITDTSTTDKAICMPYAPNPTTGAVTIPGSHMSYPVSGHLGRTDFGVSAAYTPYYKPTRANKGGDDPAAYTCITYLRCEGPPDTLPGGTFGQFDTCRTGLTIRPNSQDTAHYGKWAFDLYAGNPNATFVRQSNTYYAAGAMRIPADTGVNNQSPTRKVLTCVIPGITAASQPTAWTSPTPTFVSPPDTTTSLIVDGTSSWQCNEDNGLNGNWEPYLGAQLTPPHDTFMAELRNAWFLTSTDYGCWTNGVAHIKQTQGNLDNGMSTTLPYRPKTLWLGQFGSNQGVPGGKAAGVSDAALMSSYRAFVRDLHVWHTAPDDATISATTEVV